MVTTPEKPSAPERILERVALPTKSVELHAPLRLRLPASWKLTDDAFIGLSGENPEWQFETTEEGALLIMVGEGLETSALGSELVADLAIWNRIDSGGRVLGASGAARLSALLIMIPDASWVSHQRIAQGAAQHDGVLLGICPEFVVEVHSFSDSLADQQEKMERWIRYGALLGWLVDPQEETVWIYRPDSEPERVDKPDELGGEAVCEGLVVNFGRIWQSSQ